MSNFYADEITPFTVMQVQPAAAVLYHFYAQNLNTADQVFHIYDALAASLVVGVSEPVYAFIVSAKRGIGFQLPGPSAGANDGRKFVNGITIAWVLTDTQFYQTDGVASQAWLTGHQ